MLEVMHWTEYGNYFLVQYVTAENKVVIQKYLDIETKNPLIKLENLVKSENHVEAQVGFCARWLLDNICECVYLLEEDMMKINRVVNTSNFHDVRWTMASVNENIDVDFLFIAFQCW